MSAFEDFFNKNREEFDTEEISPSSWNAIERRMDRKQRHSKHSRKLAIAATLLLCFAFGFAISQFLSKDTTDQYSIEELARYSPAFAMADQTYSPVIRQVISEIADHPDYATDTAHFGVFIQQFKRLEAQNQHYLEELRKNGYREIVIEQLIKNYSARLQLLQKLQQEIRKYNHQLKTIGYEKQTNHIAI